MIINYEQFQSCYGPERRTFELLRAYESCFSEVTYISIQWRRWCNAHQAGEIDSENEHCLSNSTFSISICSAPEVLNFAAQVSNLGVTHLLVTFFVDDRTVGRFMEQGITILYLPEIEEKKGPNGAENLLYVRAMGKTGVTLEATVFNQQNIARVEANEGRVVQNNDHTPLDKVQIQSCDIRDNDIFKRLLSISSVVVIRANITEVINIICESIENGVLPVIPEHSLELLAHSNKSFSRVVSRYWNKLYLLNHPHSNLQEILAHFEVNKSWLTGYSNSCDDFVREIIELAYSLSYPRGSDEI